MVVDDDPSDCVPAPIETREVLQDRRVHGDQYPVTVAAVSDTPDNVGIGSAFGSEISDRFYLHSSIFERKNEATTGELLVQDEGGHGDANQALQGAGALHPTQRLIYLAFIDPIVRDQEPATLGVGRDLSNALDWPTAATERWGAA